jgi:4'-phosphopantetheinyl transferase
MTGIKINNIEGPDTNWLPADFCDYQPAGRTDVWKIGIQGNLHLLHTFSTMLSQAEHERAKRYHQIRDTNRFIISRGAARAILGKYLNLEPSSVEFCQGPNKKPFLKNSNLFYNISHSGDLILLAISTAEIGCDIELINRKFDFSDILIDYFSGQEEAFIAQENSIERFFILWTRKEAFTKATGKGLDDELKLVPSLDGVHLLHQSLPATVCSVHNTIYRYEFLF